MGDKVRIGVIGTSGWTEFMFLSGFESHPRAHLAAICGRNRDRAEKLAAKYGIPGVFTDYRELLNQRDLDAVVVATPDDLHYQMTMDALDLDLHILCEKPIALNALHAREMFEPYYTQPAGPRLFIDAILEDRPVEPNFYDGLRVQEVIDSIMASSREGDWVDVPQASKHLVGGHLDIFRVGRDSRCPGGRPILTRFIQGDT